MELRASGETEVKSEDLMLVKSLVEELLRDFPPDKTPAEEFWGKQFDLGLAYTQYPVGLGGLALSPALNEYVSSELRKANAPISFMRNPIGVGMAMPTVLTHGSKELSMKLLRRCYTCEDIWCQLFSEPGAGSDVASLSTRATKDGDEWVITGQKVWTTLAHVSNWGMLLARTDPFSPKHKGLSYFVVDMRAEGVEVKPLRQMTGEAEFNEVYFNDVRIPDAWRLGEIGQGWSVAITTLMNERVSIGGNIVNRGSGAIGDLRRTWERTAPHGGVQREDFMKLWIAAEANRLTNVRASQLRRAGNPGPEGSVAKLAYAELNKKIYEYALELLGPRGLLYSSYEMTRPDFARVSSGGERDIAKTFLRSRANSIEGGTSEIMRNILGERVLGLPGDIKNDRDTPWVEIPRN